MQQLINSIPPFFMLIIIVVASAVLLATAFVGIFQGTQWLIDRWRQHERERIQQAKLAALRPQNLPPAATVSPQDQTVLNMRADIALIRNQLTAMVELLQMTIKGGDLSHLVDQIAQRLEIPRFRDQIHDQVRELDERIQMQERRLSRRLMFASIVAMRKGRKKPQDFELGQYRRGWLHISDQLLDYIEQAEEAEREWLRNPRAQDNGLKMGAPIFDEMRDMSSGQVRKMAEAPQYRAGMAITFADEPPPIVPDRPPSMSERILYAEKPSSLQKQADDLAREMDKKTKRVIRRDDDPVEVGP